jgi:FAD/FMN-containing dehydrogenase
MGGLTLGGGLGHLTRQCGLTIDNLLAVDMVLADGSFDTADSREHSDLFWAVRGGGGNFGVVTCFLFKAHAIHTDYAGPMLVLGRRSGDDALVPQLYPESAESIKRLFRFPNSSARATVSRTSAQQENVWHCVVLHWAS